MARLTVGRRAWQGPRRRGHDHAGRGGAIVVVAAMLAGALPALGGRAAYAQEAPAAEASVPARSANPFVQRGVAAEATAENGVVARERALAAGRRAAWERLAAEIGAPPRLSDAEIEALIDSIIIEQERTTPTRYSGRITVNFNPGRVRAQTGAGAVAGNAAGGGLAGTAADPEAPRALGPPVATVDAIARYQSLGEWLELRRRLIGAPEVARLDIVAIAVDGARLRLGLRQPPVAAAEGLLHGAGVALAPGAGPAGAGWQVGLARGY
ncbi:hypothetical protein [Caldovatus aquaticus]|uniref:Uncharacterized protein n=1 Tax=Caldovatus aquaticus TaxID=2865671 RepID=A0ABS7F2X6_9PROT|nr:hypothetical protein [Caldovatus aquaticus]MBW8269668.1 hypothetical protein [Caldovatus aquaticus]